MKDTKAAFLKEILVKNCILGKREDVTKLVCSKSEKPSPS
jgi:hypothetical protein